MWCSWSTFHISQENHHTPRIDAVLHLYHQRGTKTKDYDDWKDVGPLTEQNGQSYESRLIQLEGQLTDLLTRSKVQQVRAGTNPGVVALNMPLQYLLEVGCRTLHVQPHGAICDESLPNSR